MKGFIPWKLLPRQQLVSKYCIGFLVVWDNYIFLLYCKRTLFFERELNSYNKDMENRKPVNFSIRPSIQCVENTSKFSFPCNIFDRHFLSSSFKFDHTFFFVTLKIISYRDKLANCEYIWWYWKKCFSKIVFQLISYCSITIFEIY